MIERQDGSHSWVVGNALLSQRNPAASWSEAWLERYSVPV